MSDTKECSGCHEILPLESFYKSSRSKCGRRSRCKQCVSLYVAANRDHVREKKAQWAKDNIERVRESARLWARKNKDKHTAYVLANRDRVNASKREWAQSNPEKVRQSKKRWAGGESGKRAIAGYMARNPAKIKARQAVNNALRDGKLIKQPCVFCGNPKSEAHHEDYAYPLDVIWACPRCHRNRFHQASSIEDDEAWIRMGGAGGQW